MTSEEINKRNPQWVKTNERNPWWIKTPDGYKNVDNLIYLNYLLEKSPEIIQSQDKYSIKCLYWDFLELKQEGLSPIYDLTINSQINSLKRILKYTPIKEYKPNPIISIDSD